MKKIIKILMLTVLLGLTAYGKPINASSRMWHIKEIEGGVQIVRYIGTETTIKIPTTINNKKVIEIGDGENHVFLGFFEERITHIDMSKAWFVERINDMAFLGCISLEEITFSSSLINIGKQAFMDCQALRSVKIPDGVTSIDDRAFENCIELKNIILPNSLTNIGNGIFVNCIKLKDIVIPNNVNNISNYAFYGCVGLERIIIQSKIINQYDTGKYDLIPSAIKSIGIWAFKGCRKLANITIPENVTSIAYGAFKNCTILTDITIPNSVSFIGNGAFYGCKRLTRIRMLSPIPIYFSDGNIFDNRNSYLRIEVPMTSVKTYKKANKWRNYSDKIIGYD